MIAYLPTLNSGVFLVCVNYIHSLLDLRHCGYLVGAPETTVGFPVVSKLL